MVNQISTDYANGFDAGRLDMFVDVERHLLTYQAILKSYSKIIESENTTLELLKHVHEVDKIFKEFE